MHEATPGNHRFIHHVLKQRFGEELPQLKILDFGCGNGGLVDFLRAQGLDAIGADPFGARYTAWHKDHLYRIEDGRLPFNDGYFDIVVTNQVFEHVQTIEPCLAEIERVLKPGGFFLSLFPTMETLYEAHSGVYGAHYLSHEPQILKLWLLVCRNLGFGLWKEDRTPVQWADAMGDIITKECFYRTHGAIKQLWRNAFGQEPRLHQAEYLKFRRPELGFLPNAVAGLITTLRAGIVISVVK